MANDARAPDAPGGPTVNDPASIDAETLVTQLETSLRSEPAPDAEAEGEIRKRLLGLYLTELGDPLSAAMHAEALLARQTVDEEVLDVATALLEHRPIAARIAEKLSAAYARVGAVESEMGMLTKELSLARPPRLDHARRRLADLHFEHLGDAAGALDLVEPLVLRSPGDDALRARYLQMAASSAGVVRAIRTLLRASRTEKDAGARARILFDLGELHLKAGDVRRARQALLEAVEAAPGEKGLAAATLLLRLEPDDPKVIGSALEVVVRSEPDPAKRRAAAERLLGLPGTSAEDDRAIAAWRALVDSPRRDEALDQLSALLEKRNDVAGLVEVLRAKGPSPAAHARLIPLLEKGGLWKELAETLERQAELAPANESAEVLSRLGRVRMSRLADAEGAFTAFRRSLELDPKNAKSRSALEKMMSEGTYRLQAAELLERVYRAEGLADGLARVLQARAALSTSPAEKLSALDRAFEAARVAALPRPRLLSLAEAGLGQAAQHEPHGLPSWLPRYRELTAASTDPSGDADVLVRALGGRAVDGPELTELACAAVDALSGSGRAEPARVLCAAALASSPTPTELLHRYDRIVGTAEPARERLGRYQAALDRTAEPGERRRIMQRLATMCREDVDDLPRAIELWQHILQDDPKDLDALLGLLSAYERLENPEALFEEIGHALDLFDGEPRTAILLRKASALSKFGQREESSALRRQLLEQPNLKSSIVESILTAAYEDDQPGVYRRALEILTNSDEPAVRMRALERLGDFHFEQLGDRRAAIDSWKPAARLLTKDSHEDEHARELYERVLQASPDDREAASRLVELYAKAGEWARVPEVYGALLRSEGGVEAAISKLLGLERDATHAGAVDEYVSMVEEALPRLGTRARETQYQLIRAKARILSADPARQSEASAAHRQLIEAFGTDSDVDAFAAFIESRGSADDRRADLRWLFDFRSRRAPDPVEVLREWAKLEEEYGDVEGTIRVEERILEHVPRDREALEALSRLKRLSGDLEGCLVALRALGALGEGAEPKRAAELALDMARLLANDLGRPLDAVVAVEPCLRGPAPSREALDLARRALRAPGARARAIEVIERVSRDESPRAAMESLRLLVEEAGRDAAVPESARASWYERLIELCADDLDAALELAKESVRDVPNVRASWETLERLARRADRPEEASEAYRSAMGRGMEPGLGEAIGRRIIDLLDESSSDSEVILGTLEPILEHVPHARWALDRVKLVLSAQARWEELFALYDRAIDNAASDPERAALLDEAAVVARDLARAPERAIAFLEQLLELRPADAPVQAALERLYERGGKTQKLIELLSARLEGMTGLARLEVSRRIAAAHVLQGDTGSAVEVVNDILERGASVDDVKDVLEQVLTLSGEQGPVSRAKKGVLERAASLLSAHYAAVGLPHELIRVTRAMLSLSRDPTERARCGRDLVRLHLETAEDPGAAFSSARAALKAELADDPALEEVALRTLLDEATRDWRGRGGGPDSDAARAARATILELSELHLRAERPERAVAVLTSGAALPFTLPEKRELRSRIAVLLEDGLNDPARARAVLAELFEEDAGDAVALACAERFARLLEAAGRNREQAELWERIGESLALAERVTPAREAWARAASLREALGDADGAVVAHSAGAALGSESAMQSLARLHAEAGRWLAAAQTLEWLFFSVTGEARVRSGLALADAYARAGDRALARNRLADLVRAEPAAEAPRVRLLELYREDAAWGALADLLVDTARSSWGVTGERERRLDLMREAVDLRLRRLSDPGGAVALATAVLEMDPESEESHLDLGEALDAAGRHDEAVTVLRDGLSAGGKKRSKNKGPLHRAIASALFHAGRRAEGLTELAAAARLNPTDPTTLYELARLSADEGELELAERTLRTLLLTLHHGAEPTPVGPSRAEVYLDLSRIVEARGDAAQARDLVESAFDSALESPEQGARLERALEQRGRHDLLALALERRLRSAGDPEVAAPFLDALVTLWEGPLGRTEDVRLVILRHAELLGRAAEETSNVAPSVWAAHVRACAAASGESARVDAVRRHISTLTRAAERAKGAGASTLLLEAAALHADGLGERERAATLMEALFESDPADLQVWEQLRDLHAHLGRRGRLVELVEAALSSPNSSPVRRRLRLALATLLLEDPARVDAAIVTLRGLLEDEAEDEPRDAVVGRLLADVLEREGRHEDLAAVLSEALGDVSGAEHRLLSMRLARALEGASRASEAAAVYGRLAGDEEASTEELRAVSARLEALGSDRLPDCLERLAALETGPEVGRLARRLAELREAQKDRPGALRALALGFASNPEDPHFLERLVRAHEEEGRWDQVAAVMQRAAAREPSNRPLLQRLVEAHQRNLDPGSALAVLNEALRERPSDAELLRMRAWIHEAEGRFDDALFDLENAHADDPGLTDDLVAALAGAAARGDDPRSLQLVDLLLSHDRAAEARSTLEALLERRPTHVGGLERLASLSAAEGDWASARTACQRLLPLLDGDPARVARMSLVLADACEGRGGLADATDALERALELVPGSAEIRSRLARAYEASGEKRRLADLLEAEAADATAIEDRASLLLRAAELVLEVGGPAGRALELVERSRAIDPHRAESLLVHGQSLARLGRHGEAESTLRELSKVGKGRGPGLVSRAHLELARLHLLRDDLFEALDGLKQSFNAEPKNDEAGFLLGLVALDLDDEPTAMRALRAVTAPRSTLTSESKAVAFYHLARVARAKGDLRRAKQMATSAVLENENDFKARALLETL